MNVTAEEAQNDRAVRAWVPRVARLLDTQFRVPGTKYRFGLDPIVGLIPVVGDTLTMLVGASMLIEAKRLGLGARAQFKMIGNLLFDWVIGLVPGLDLLLDTAVKAHSKNAAMLEEHARGEGNGATTAREVTDRPDRSCSD